MALLLWRRCGSTGYTRALYDQLLRHELMHVLEYYLVGEGGTYASVEKWFHEGIAMVVGGAPPNQIRTVAAMQQWRSDMALSVTSCEAESWTRMEEYLE